MIICLAGESIEQLTRSHSKMFFSSSKEMKYSSYRIILLLKIIKSSCRYCNLISIPVLATCCRIVYYLLHLKIF